MSQSIKRDLDWIRRRDREAMDLAATLSPNEALDACTEALKLAAEAMEKDVAARDAHTDLFIAMSKLVYYIEHHGGKLPSGVM